MNDDTIHRMIDRRAIILKARYQALSSWIILMIIVLILAMPFLGLAAGLAVRFFNWVK